MYKFIFYFLEIMYRSIFYFLEIMYRFIFYFLEIMYRSIFYFLEIMYRFIFYFLEIMYRFIFYFLEIMYRFIFYFFTSFFIVLLYCHIKSYCYTDTIVRYVWTNIYFYLHVRYFEQTFIYTYIKQRFDLLQFWWFFLAYLHFMVFEDFYKLLDQTNFNFFKDLLCRLLFNKKIILS